MSAKGNKAKASKTAPKDPTPKRAPSAGRLPVRSPIDDGMRSQMFNLEPALQYRSRRDSSPLVPGLAMDPPRKKRKSRVSVENTPASAADQSSSADDTTISTSAVDKSSSAEDTASSASAADKSSSAEDTPNPPLGIRLSEAVDQRLLQLSSSRTPEKEHSAMDGDNCSGNKSGNTPPTKVSRPKTAPWGDVEDPEDEETKSSDPPSALHAEKHGLVLVSVSNRHNFKVPSPTSSGITTDSEDDKSPSPDLSGRTEKILDEIIEGTSAYREFIRSGGSPKNNEQWLAHLAKNLAGDKRSTKCPPGTPQSRELEEENAPAKPTLSVDPPARIPLDLRLTEEELRLREARASLGKLTSLVSSVMSNPSLRATVDPKSIAINDLNESLERIAQEPEASVMPSVIMPSVNTGASTNEDRSRYSAFLKELKVAQTADSAIVSRDSALMNEQKASESVVDMTNNEEEGDEEGNPPLGIHTEEDLLNELEKRFKDGLLDTLEDTLVAFQTLLG